MDKYIFINNQNNFFKSSKKKLKIISIMWINLIMFADCKIMRQFVGDFLRIIINFSFYIICSCSKNYKTCRILKQLLSNYVKFIKKAKISKLLFQFQRRENIVFHPTTVQRAVLQNVPHWFAPASMIQHTHVRFLNRRDRHVTSRSRSYFRGDSIAKAAWSSISSSCVSRWVFPAVDPR